MRTRPDKITKISLKGGAVEVDEAGYLVDPAAWSEEFARFAAAEEGLDLDPLHWRVFAFMRSYLDDRGIAADARFTLDYLGKTRALDKVGSKRLLYELFPYGYVQQACKLAGMIQPRAWSTG